MTANSREKRVSAVVAALCLVWSWGVAAADSEERVFTNTDGKEIVAKIVSATSGSVTIEMAGGKKFTVAVTKFIEADQKFIAGWLEKNPPAINYSLVMTDSRKRVDRNQRKAGQEKITEENWFFNLKLTNRSGADLDGLQVRYRIYTSLPVSGKSRARTTSTKDGALELSTLKTSDEIEFATKEFMITRRELDSGYYWADGSKGDKVEDIEGVWVKVFHDGQNVLNYQAGNSDVKKASWADAKALALAPSKE